MRVIRNRPEWIDGALTERRCAVAIGNFDGVHRGHQVLLERCRAYRDAHPGTAAAVVTFEPLPLAYFRPDMAPARLSTIYRKLGLLAAQDIDLAWQMRFDDNLAALSPREFAANVLGRCLRASHVVIGDDFRFGSGREGNVERLRQYGEEMDFTVETVAAVMHEGERISSSGIRQMLAAGNFEGARQWLGRPFRMEGHVIRGQGLGRKLGYPTANLAIRAEPSPLSGVLAAVSRIGNGPWLPAVTNLGRRPVVGGKDPLLEVHYFDFNEDLYGKRLDVQFVAKLRDELDFASIDDLVEQMKKDEHEARAILADFDSRRL